MLRVKVFNATDVYVCHIKEISPDIVLRRWTFAVRIWSIVILIPSIELLLCWEISYNLSWTLIERSDSTWLWLCKLKEVRFSIWARGRDTQLLVGSLSGLHGWMSSTLISFRVQRWRHLLLISSSISLRDLFKITLRILWTHLRLFRVWLVDWILKRSPLAWLASSSTESNWGPSKWCHLILLKCSQIDALINRCDYIWDA